PRDLEASLSILGEHGSVILGGHAVNRIDCWQFDVAQPEDDAIRAQASEDVPNVYGNGHADYLADVVDAILTHRRAAVEGEEGRKNVEILTAMYESAARGGAAVRPGDDVIVSRIGRSPDDTGPPRRRARRGRDER